MTREPAHPQPGQGVRRPAVGGGVQARQRASVDRPPAGRCARPAALSRAWRPTPGRPAGARGAPAPWDGPAGQPRPRTRPPGSSAGSGDLGRWPEPADDAPEPARAQPGAATRTHRGQNRTAGQNAPGEGRTAGQNAPRRSRTAGENGPQAKAGPRTERRAGLRADLRLEPQREHRELPYRSPGRLTGPGRVPLRAAASSSLRTDAYTGTYSWPDRAWMDRITSSVTARRCRAAEGRSR